MAGKELRRGAEYAVIGRQLAGNQIRCDIVADANIEIHPSLTKSTSRSPDIETQLQLRVLESQRRQRRGDNPTAKAEATDNTQRSLRHLAHVGKLIHHLIDILQNALRPFIDPLPLR